MQVIAIMADYYFGGRKTICNFFIILAASTYTRHCENDCDSERILLLGHFTICPQSGHDHDDVTICLPCLVPLFGKQTQSRVGKGCADKKSGGGRGGGATDWMSELHWCLHVEYCFCGLCGRLVTVFSARNIYVLLDNKPWQIRSSSKSYWSMVN